jgi:hypothetical protein
MVDTGPLIVQPSGATGEASKPGLWIRLVTPRVSENNNPEVRLHMMRVKIAGFFISLAFPNEKFLRHVTYKDINYSQNSQLIMKLELLE